jgi:predicted tellurium resistance membrane protein TerC
MIGLAISIPLIVFGSSVMLRLMQRFPFIVVLGGALLGYISGEMAVSDSVIHPWLAANAGWVIHLSGIGCALGVVVVGRWLAKRKTGLGTDRVL